MIAEVGALAVGAVGGYLVGAHKAYAVIAALKADVAGLLSRIEHLKQKPASVKPIGS